MAKYDFMSFGEAMVRFTPPGHDRLGQAEVLELGIAAAELNCCVNISNLSRKLLKPQMKTAYVTKLVDAWDGDYIIKHAQMHGVDMSNVVVDPYDKIGRNGRNGKCFIEVGIGPRPSYQTYDRVGGGDSFASGLIWNLLNGRPEQECIDFAAAYSALCHTIRNDWNLVTTEEAYDVMNGGSARVKR